jgi:hypothetical protein
MKLQSFCTEKEMASKLKSLYIGWEKIFARYTPDKGDKQNILRTQKLKSHKINDPMKE